MRTKFTYLALFLIPVLAGAVPPSLDGHPFLLVKKENYHELRSRALADPWAAMQSGAFEAIEALPETNADSPLSEVCESIRSICAHGSLAYILNSDYEHRSRYRTKIVRALLHWENVYKKRPPIGLKEGNHRYMVVQAGQAFFNSVLALDILYNDLSEDELNAIEVPMEQMAEWFYQVKFHPEVMNSGWDAWPLNRLGCAGIWSVYAGAQLDSARGVVVQAGKWSLRIQEIVDDYKSTLDSYFTEDGVFREGTGYAAARLTHRRVSKAHFMDVLEFTGIDRSFYANPKLINAMEWIFGYTPTPFGFTRVFGDSAPKSVAFHYGPATYRAHRFSGKAAGYASWVRTLQQWSNTKPAPTLLFYLSMDQINPPLVPTSRIFDDGGAFFMESPLTEESVSVSLWNPTAGEDYGHAHREVNAIELCALGETVLQNSGYAGSGQGMPGDSRFDWKWIHHTAESGNTVSIDGLEHLERYGGGITEGFTSFGLDYASGDSGAALPNGRHTRNLVLVHARGEAHGYVLCFDEIEANSLAKTAIAAWHPHADALGPLKENFQYSFPVHPKTFQPDKDVVLTIGLGTEPFSTEIKEGGLALYDESFVGKYLSVSYELDDGLSTRFVTAFLAHEANEPIPSFSRLQGAGYTGLKLSHIQPFADIALESDGESVCTLGTASFRAKAALWRHGTRGLEFYFIRSGSEFSDGADRPTGFRSTGDVSLHVNGLKGKITTRRPVKVTFLSPGLTSVYLNGEHASSKEDPSGGIILEIPAGQHELRLERMP